MLKICQDCATAFAADLPACPHCLSEDWLWNTEVDAAPVAPVVKRKAPKAAEAP